jgi:hypothetical protein
MPKKVYRSKHYKSLVITVVVDHRKIFCEFDGGTSRPKEINGSYSTTDIGIQRALESSGAFNVQFVLEKEILLENEIRINKDTVAAVKSKTEEVERKEESAKAEQLELATGKEMKKIEGISNFQSVRSYLNKEFDVSFSDLPNKPAVIAKCKALGVEFTDWK